MVVWTVFQDIDTLSVTINADKIRYFSSFYTEGEDLPGGGGGGGGRADISNGFGSGSLSSSSSSSSLNGLVILPLHAENILVK